MPKPSTDFRPRLEPSNHGVGPGPLSPYWRVEPDAPQPTEPLAILTRELETFRAECVAAVRNIENVGVSPIARNEVEWLNTRLVEVQRLNAGLTRNRRSSTIADWPSPPLPTGVLFGPRELLRPLSDALLVLASVEAQRQVARYA